MEAQYKSTTADMQYKPPTANTRHQSAATSTQYKNQHQPIRSTNQQQPILSANQQQQVRSTEPYSSQYAKQKSTTNMQYKALPVVHLAHGRPRVKRTSEIICKSVYQSTGSCITNTALNGGLEVTSCTCTAEEVFAYLVSASRCSRQEIT